MKYKLPSTTCSTKDCGKPRRSARQRTCLTCHAVTMRAVRAAQRAELSAYRERASQRKATKAEPTNLREATERFRRRLVVKTMAQVNGVSGKAAQQLGVGRNQLSRLLNVPGMPGAIAIRHKIRGVAA